MNRSIIISSVLHFLLILVTAMSLPFLAKKPLDIPPIVSVELIQIAEKTNIPFAPKAKKSKRLNTEPYVSETYNFLLEKKMKIASYLLKPKNYFLIGIPKDYNLFKMKYKNDKSNII